MPNETNTNTSFKIMGARTNNTSSWLYARKKLVALDRQTLIPIEVHWRYENETESKTGKYFSDTDPNQRIIATLGSENITLNIANISSDCTSIVAIKNDGKATSYVNPANGGTMPDFIENHNIRLASGGSDSLLAINKENELFTWGSDENGVLDTPDGLSTMEIEQIRGGSGAICVMGKKGDIKVWGKETQLPPNEIATLSDVKNIYSGFDFAVLRKNGKIASWGEVTNAPPEDISALDDIVDVAAGGYGFAAIREYTVRKVVGWGSKYYDMDVPDNIASLDDIAEVHASLDFFVARRTNGSVVAWGENDHGCAQVPSQIAALTDIIDVQLAGETAVAILRENGTVMAWGGPISSAVPAGLNDVIALSGIRGAFAALKSNGTVVGWGIYTTEGMEDQLTDVCGVYSNGNSFWALKNDDTVVVWGDKGWGGDMADVPTDLQGNISYEAK
ncbi:TPA: hypothetical protein N5K71_002474 [Enterobacter hormaechei subsp. steigerwaltii]|uniref:RCC1 domain-containing protein n=1 Tax=Enterobacter hormaechei TaxID=158836 RepID=UPI002076447D|nr:hypothetical protein [Enterobacter hormaechei]ELW9489125.1 hypothetical protein [Enterobacter hormaechei]MCM7457443.1 hypothetical protein [Enterobacter hormaechei]MED5727232.1 hypothetical protein [Enterobacter hormaechei]HCM9100482.1 hypothetical protein [Enterobacter hormaechei subsp. steigerwaltii]